MKNLKLFWIYLIRFREWNIYIFIDHFFWKLKDYDRIQDDYSKVLLHATNDNMSKTNYELTAIYSEMNRVFKGDVDFYKLDIIDLIDAGATVEEIKKYLMS